MQQRRREHLAADLEGVPGDRLADAFGHRHRIGRRIRRYVNREHPAGEMGGDVFERQHSLEQPGGFKYELFDGFEPHGVTNGGVIREQDVQHAALVVDLQAFEEKSPAVQTGGVIVFEQVLELLVVGALLRGGIPHDDLGARLVVHPGRRAFQQDREG